MKEKLIKIGKFLMEYDFLWSVPSIFTIFVLFPYLGEALFGDGFAFYPPSFFHAGIYAVLRSLVISSCGFVEIISNVPTIVSISLSCAFCIALETTV